jgi:hypothetical protein
MKTRAEAAESALAAEREKVKRETRRIAVAMARVKELEAWLREKDPDVYIDPMWMPKGLDALDPSHIAQPAQDAERTP